MAQQMLQNGISVHDFYESSLSDTYSALGAKPRKDRIQDPRKLAEKLMSMY